MTTECHFCQSPPEDFHQVIEKGDLLYSQWDFRQHNPGHGLVIPYRHVDSVLDMTADEWAELQPMLQTIRQTGAELHGVTDYNIFANTGRFAGQTVFHAHMHLVPRFEGDEVVVLGGRRAELERAAINEA